MWPIAALALQRLDDRLAGEDVADQAEVAVGVELLAVEADDAGGLLAAVLQGVQPQRGVRRGVGMAEDAEDAAFLVQLVVVEWIGREAVPGANGSCAAKSACAGAITDCPGAGLIAVIASTAVSAPVVALVYSLRRRLAHRLSGRAPRDRRRVRRFSWPRRLHGHPTRGDRFRDQGW